jgi:hypothetical protein
MLTRISTCSLIAVSITYKNGLVTFTLPLVSKNEECLFTLKPINDTVGHFVEYLKSEDKAVEKAGIYKLGMASVTA